MFLDRMITLVDEPLALGVSWATIDNGQFTGPLPHHTFDNFIHKFEEFLDCIAHSIDCASP